MGLERDLTKQMYQHLILIFVKRLSNSNHSVAQNVLKTIKIVLQKTTKVTF